jgi:hypothetical protein
MIHPPSPLAFGIGHAAMLGWLAAAAAPLLIHLWSRRKYREVPWAAMDWLLAALRKNARRIRIEQWILLAVRTLLIVCVVLAFAEPFFERVGLTAAAGQRSHKLIIVDGSYSMGATVGEKSYFEQAKELAEAVVERGSEGDAYTLILMANPPRTIVATPAFDARDVVQELRNLKLPSGDMDLAATLVKAEEILRRAGHDHPRLAHQEVFLFTDLQRIGWLAAQTLAQRADFRRRAERIARLARLHVIDLGEHDNDNLAITDLRVADSVPTAGRELAIEAQVHNFGRQPVSRQKLELWIDKRQVDETVVDIPSGDDVVVRFAYRFDAVGEHAVELRAARDVLDIDNHRYLALPVRQAVRVLCVNGKPGGGEFGQPTDYLMVALAPDGDTPRATIRPEAIRDSQLLETDLAEYDCAFFCNVAQFTAAEARFLAGYLRQGGGVVFFLGDQVQPASYDRFLVGEEPGIARLLPGRVGNAVAEADYRLNPLGYRHPLLTVFRDQEQAGLITAPVRRYFRLTAYKDGQAKAALALSNGDPLILEEPIERGRVVLCATSADISWNMLPVLPSYVPLVHELLNLAMSGRNTDRNVEVGQPLSADLGEAAAAPVAVATPEGGRHEVRRVGGLSGWHYPDTQQSGIYSVEFESSQPARLYAVNVNTNESDLTRISVDELRQEVWPGVPLELHTAFSAAENAGDMQTIARSGKLNLLLLYAALALLLGDSVLGWHFGHHRT